MAMTNKLPGEEWKAYQRRTGGDYTTWRRQLADEAEATIRRCREALSPEEREAASRRGREAVREIMDEWNAGREQLKD
jgi:gamma-glutamyl:cysteine ligase YbdK (ATP-grasp superfamily)